MRIAIIGSGHVGLVTGLCFAERGHEVLCVDHDAGKIRTLKAGKIPFHEPGMQDLLTKHRRSGTITFSTKTADGVAFAPILFICVSTPNLPDGNVDMRYFEAVGRDIAAALEDYRVIVEKSTVPIRTSEHIRKTISRYAGPRAAFDVASNPEFLREGAAVRDTLSPDRIVIGVESKKAEKLLKEAYAGFDAPLVITSIHSAEMIKLASNAYLAMRLSFINGVSRICELGGADVDEVARGMGLDPRIGASFLKAGIGYGGSCFPKDVDGLYHVARNMGYDFTMLREVQHINEDQWRHFVRRIEDELWTLSGKTIALWGLAFKPDTDDLRESPAMKIARTFLERGATVRAYDPAAMDAAKAALPGLDMAKNPLDAAKGADALVLCTEWAVFLDVAPAKLHAAMRVPLVFDGRNVLNGAALRKAGFGYFSVGRMERLER